MFCKRCGAQIADDAKFCPVCNQQTFAGSEQTAHAQPAAKKLSRRQYYSKKAPSNLKKMNLISIIIGLLCALLIFIPTYRAFNAPLYDYPLLKLFDSKGELDAVADEYDEVLKDLRKELKDNDIDDLSEEIEETFEEEFGVSIKDLEKKHGTTVKEFMSLFDPLSFNNLVKMAEIVDINSEISDAIDILNTLKTVMYVFCVIFVIITLIGTLLQKTWVMVLAYILSSWFIFINGGILIFILATVLYIAAAVLYSKLKKNYTAYLADPAA